MNLKRLLLTACVCAGLLPVNAQAERMNYAYIEIGPQLTDLDDAIDTKGDGIYLRGSWIYGPYAFSDLRYEDIGLDGSTDATSILGRLGARVPVDIRSPMRLDIYGMLALESVDIEQTTSGTMLDESGVGVVAGARFGPIEELEAGLELSYTDLGDQSAEFITVEGIWNISYWFALTASYRDGKYDMGSARDLDRRDATLGIRFQFGGDQRRTLSGRPL